MVAAMFMKPLGKVKLETFLTRFGVRRMGVLGSAVQMSVHSLD